MEGIAFRCAHRLGVVGVVSQKMSGSKSTLKPQYQFGGEKEDAAEWEH